MKINKPLDKILDNEAKVKILRFLIKTRAEWNGRQIAKEVGVTPATAHKALHGLYEEGAEFIQIEDSVRQLLDTQVQAVYRRIEDEGLIKFLLKKGAKK